jgi:5-formyltetrahydrofolate cyclo-ligase
MALQPVAAAAESAHVPCTHFPMTRDRAALRGELRGRRRALPAAERIAAAERLADRLHALPFAPHNGHAAGYWAMDGEIALHAWQLRLPSTVAYCLPVLHEDGRLRFAPWRPGAPLVANRYGIPEPDVPDDALLAAEAMDFVVVPLVAFDTSGHRLGMGAGWYDRSFAFRSARAAPPWLVGAGFAAQRVDTLSPRSWDVALDGVCTERDTFLTAATSA